MTIHKLKTIQPYFAEVISGAKPFEVRYNDRNYQVGDRLHLLEYCNGNFTGRHKVFTITYILKDFAGLHIGWVVLGIQAVTFRRDLLKYLGFHQTKTL